MNVVMPGSAEDFRFEKKKAVSRVWDLDEPVGSTGCLRVGKVEIQT